MVQSPSWEANWFAASQEITRISRNPNVHNRTHKLPSTVSILASPIHSIYPHPTSRRSILILSTHLRLGLPSGLLPSGFPTKTLYTPLFSLIRATCPAHCGPTDTVLLAIIQIYSIWRRWTWNFVNPWSKCSNEYSRFYDSLRPLCVLKVDISFCS